MAIRLVQKTTCDWGVLRPSAYPTALEAARGRSGCSLSRRTGEGQGEGRFFGNTPAVRHSFLHKQLCLTNPRQRISMNTTTCSPVAEKNVRRLKLLYSRAKILGHARYPSPALRAPSPLEGERSASGGSLQHVPKLLRIHMAVVAGLCALSFSPPDSGAAGQGVNSEPRSRFIIGISPFLDKSVKDEVYRGIVLLVVEDLPLNSTLSIYDAFELRTITQFLLPDARAFNSPKTRANQFAPAIRDLKLFLAEEPHKPTNSHSSFAAAIRLPQFLDFLAETTTMNSKTSVLLIGSPLYQDAKEPAFSMVDGYFPSDGHLQASREQSVYGFSSDGTVDPPLILRWIYFGDPWVSDLHKEKITRFWTLYLERRGVQLAAFTGDLPIALQSFRQPGAASATKHWTVDTTQRKIEMLRVSRGVTMTDWLTRDSLPAGAPAPPSIRVGPMKIGIRWKERIDLDLYATPRPGAETLYFEHVRSPEGYYYKDHRSSPGRDYEFIEFESPVDVREVEAFINFYKGSCPGGARGEVRIEFDGRIYGSPFFLPAEQGNLGRSGPSQHEFWAPIPIQRVLNLVQQPIATRRTD